MSSTGTVAMDQLFVNIPSSINALPQTPRPIASHPNNTWNAVLDQDEYEDDLPDLPPSSSRKDNKQIRRRSSKACDQCRKSKCKCERPGSQDEPCKNCILLGTPCTFLGPSRKRGPPKGYIDAIETRLHQLEALLSTLLSSGDPRASSIMADLTGDPLANEILARVTESPLGTRGRVGDALEDRASRIVRTSATIPTAVPHPFASPSVEWQDHLKERLKAGAGKIGGVASGPPRLNLVTDIGRSSRASIESSTPAGESPRQRRRLDSSGSQSRPHPSTNIPADADSHSHLHHPNRATPSVSPASATSSSDEDDEELASAVGQLSLNEDSQVRYHGQVSGLHILGQSDRLDQRNEGGIWRFPKAGVWPRAVSRHNKWKWEAQDRECLPNIEEQRELLGLYFAYVHPVLPMMQQKQFWYDFRGEPDPVTKSSPGQRHVNIRSTSQHASPSPGVGVDASSASASNSAPNPDTTNPITSGNAAPKASYTTSIVPGENRVPTLLLLAMFAVAARYRAAAEAPLPPSEGKMWNGGDEYLEDAKRILNQTYASSRPSTCQALLLLSYREIGIGAMAQAWLYVGMAVRMAQDLGLHRSADRWQRTGSELFSATERQVRKRIWFSCVIMDKYVSTYIGRPLSIFERDFDTPYPTEEVEEEMELWQSKPTAHGGTTPKVEEPSSYVPVPVRLISCFTACARLSGILSNIVETIYAVHPPPTHSRHTESAILEKRLDKWYVELPEHLQLNCSSTTTPPPHVLTLHMQYWCSVLLVHRPFMRRKSQQGIGAPSQENDAEASASCRKAFDLCAMAATRISNIVMKYKENFCLRRSPAFLTYYVFSAGIMHVTTLSVRSVDVQAALGLQRCMDALETMNTIWPSAGRAWELLHGAKIDMRDVELSRQAHRRLPKLDKRKRAPEDTNDSNVTLSEPREASNAAADNVVATHPLSDLELGNREPATGVPPSMRTANPPGHPQNQLSQPQQYSLGLDMANPPTNSFPEFERWSTQEGFSYQSGLTGLGTTSFVDSGSFDSPKDLWNGFPEQQFADPSLITSSLYGLPVISGPMQGQAPPFLGELSLYSSEWFSNLTGFVFLTMSKIDIQTASGSNSQ
ncbi:fungal-specific transcription factor domain-containing protein [Gautieria morchelliformis]|nr:fungal-specific transcription factor domain-containing protein [Gautieria morchelliformis]